LAARALLWSMAVRWARRPAERSRALRGFLFQQAYLASELTSQRRSRRVSVAQAISVWPRVRLVQAVVADFQRSAIARGQWYGCFCGGPQTQVSLAANRMYYIPFLALETKTFTKIAVYVSTNAGTNCRLGVYSAGTGLPNALIDDSGTVSSASTGFKTITGRSIALTTGTWYYLAVLCDGAPSLQGIGGTNSSGQTLQDALLGASASGLRCRSELRGADIWRASRNVPCHDTECRGG